MPAEPISIFPVGLVERLTEYERLLSLSGYGQWRAEQILEQLDYDDMTEPDRRWVQILAASGERREFLESFIFEDLQRSMTRFDSDEKLFLKFLIRVIQKKPGLANRAVGMLD